MAVRFDAERVEALGQPVPLTETVMHAVFTTGITTETGAAQVAVSANGTLVYAGGGTYPLRAVAVIRRPLDGDDEPVLPDGQAVAYMRVSPDGRRLAFVSGRASVRNDLWVHDLTRGVTQRLETGAVAIVGVAWSPDGESIVYTGWVGEEPPQIYRIPAAGGAPERLTDTDTYETASSVAPDGTIAYVSIVVKDFTTGLSGGEIGVLPPGGSPQPLDLGQGSSTFPAFSPDGRWLAYVSDANGSENVYIRPYPGPGAPTLVTNASGPALAVAPAWTRDGRRLYYKTGTPLPGSSQVMAVDVDTGDGLRVGTPERIMAFGFLSAPVRSYDVFPDGALLDRQLEDGTAVRGERELHVVVNFTEELRTRLPE